MKNKNIIETFPIFHSGYMSGKDVFSVLISMKMVSALEHYVEKENICILTEDILKTFFKDLLLNKAIPVSDEVAEKAESILKDDKTEFGIFQQVLDYTDWNLMTGSLAYDLFSAIYDGKAMYKCTAAELPGGRIVLLDFLEADSMEELARIVRYAVYKLANKDITGSNPSIENNCIKAVRPPADEWGMIIYRR